MLVPHQHVQLSSSDESSDDACVAQPSGHVTQEHLVAPLQVRVLAIELKDVQLKGNTYARITRMLLKDFGIEITEANISAYGHKIIDLTRRFHISPVSTLAAAYLLHKIKPRPAGDLLQLFYASLLVSVSIVECSFVLDPVNRRPVCREHGRACALRETWLSAAMDLFDSPQQLEHFEDIAYKASRVIFPLSSQDLEYFAETCLTSRSARQKQRVPGTLYHLLDCFDGDFE